MATMTEASIKIPHCGQYSKGAKLDREVPKQAISFETVAVGTRNDPAAVLKVRSYAFYRWFQQLNKAK